MEENRIIILIIAGGFLLILMAVFIVLFLFLHTKRKQKHILEKQQLQLQFSQTLLQSQLEIQEQTLQHVSHELHDNLGQIASLIKINLNTLNPAIPELAAEKITNTKELTRQLISDIKSLSVSLGSDHLSQIGFIKALELEVDRLNKTGQFIASFDQRVVEVDLPGERMTILYRMVQEVLNNCIKHSKAKHIDLLLQSHGNSYILAINDDGAGFNKPELKAGTSAGLKNLEYRAGLIDANLTITSSAGNGTQVMITFPAD